eukprot:9376798-Karenia_brevis.AAC.1
MLFLNVALVMTVTLMKINRIRRVAASQQNNTEMGIDETHVVQTPRSESAASSNGHMPFTIFQMTVGN